MTAPSKFIPLGTIVTVFGTGSEMNNGAVITHEDKKDQGRTLGRTGRFCLPRPQLLYVRAV